MAEGDQNNLTQLTVDLLGAYVANNTVEHGDLAQLIQSTHAALKGIEVGEAPAPEEPEHRPAVSLRKSLGSKTHIISMIDGKPYQTLKRHLSKHGLSPDQYRERYGLPKTYPMVAAAYSDARRAIAEKLGLGRKVKGAQDAPQVESKPAKAVTPSEKAALAAEAPKRAGRPRKAAPAPAVATEVETTKATKAPIAKGPVAKPAKPRASQAKTPPAAANASLATAPTPAKSKPATTEAPRSKAKAATTA